jgi:uncharacterized protein (TIGR02145 family)
LLFTIWTRKFEFAALKKLEKYATVLGVYVLLTITSLNVLIAQENSTIRDLDGNTYNTAKIGSLTWMIENLKTTRFNDGTTIPIVTDKTAWAALSTPAYCWYNNDTTYKNAYGALYNGYTISTGKLCPAGWHVSTNTEWSALLASLGGESVAGAKLKETGSNHWSVPNSGATNESLFTALPGGSRYSNGLFFSIKNLGYWWSPIERNTFNSWYRSMYYQDNAVSLNFIDSTNGFSVRCVKD